MVAAVVAAGPGERPPPSRLAPSGSSCCRSSPARWSLAAMSPPPRSCSRGVRGRRRARRRRGWRRAIDAHAPTSSLLWTDAALVRRADARTTSSTPCPCSSRQTTTRASPWPRRSASTRSIAPDCATWAARFPLALEYARRANARHLEHYVLGWICITLHRGTLPVDEAIARATEILEASTSTYVRTSAIGAIGLLRAMKGEFDEARALVEEVRRTLEELGLRQAAAAHSIAVAEVEAMAGDDAAAERILRAGFAAVTALGDEHSAMNVAWRLGLALARQGKVRRGGTLRPDRASAPSTAASGSTSGGGSSSRAIEAAPRRRAAARGSSSSCARADGRRSRRAACTPMRCSSQPRRCARPGCTTRPARSSPRRRRSRNGLATSSRGGVREEAQRVPTA